MAGKIELFKLQVLTGGPILFSDQTVEASLSCSLSEGGRHCNLPQPYRRPGFSDLCMYIAFVKIFGSSKQCICSVKVSQYVWKFNFSKTTTMLLEMR